MDSAGKVMFAECHAHRITHRNQKVILNVVRDTSERVKAERALKESHQTLLTVMDGIQATINHICQ